MPVWLERFALAILASAFLGIVILNSMKLDNIQRLGIGVAIFGLSIYVAQTLHLHNLVQKTPKTIAQDRATAPTVLPALPPKTGHRVHHEASPANISQQGKNNIAQIGNNNQATINEVRPDREWPIAQLQCMALKGTPTKVHIMSVMGDAESSRFSTKVAQVLAGCGWEIASFGTQVYIGSRPNILITSKTEDDAAADLLVRALAPIPVERKIAPEMTADWGLSIVIGPFTDAH